ncbi:hypothetical protein Acr_27g0007130 [Actinidia rufa]|uniref:Uncharacterized protein n=1 Tax=Actinidia rufa TaxID=165716 RepID=A0A7J0H870_9ERIC|nr:hypothetical protein Acr_27g0007130 [Actinidia rufa]
MKSYSRLVNRSSMPTQGRRRPMRQEASSSSDGERLFRGRDGLAAASCLDFMNEL